jgi:DNA-binding CsgD family transcriptional regulator
MRARERSRNRCHEVLAGLADAGLGPDEARYEAIQTLHRAVGFERWCWPLTDPDSALSTSGIGEVDFWPSLPRLVALEEHGDVTRKPRLVSARRPSVTLSAATRGDLARSTRWRECLRPYGIGDELMSVCRDRHGCWGSVELMRAADDSPFDEDDAAFLGRLAPTLGAMLRRGLLRRAQADADPEPLPPATLIVDTDLRVVSWTPALRFWKAALTPTETLPPCVFEIAARALTPPEESTELPNLVRILTHGGQWAVVEGAPLEGAACGSVAITFRPATAAEIADLLCKTYGLSRRERELVALVLDGRRTKELARMLCISPYTVQDHLKAVFGKTGSRNRPELVSRLTGAASAPH